MQGILTSFAQTCSPGAEVLGFPTWYEYIPCDGATNEIANFELNHIWLIVAAIIEIILRIGVLAAVIFMIIGGIRMMISAGNPDQVNAARNTLINAGVGLIIAILATTAVSFIATRLGSSPQQSGLETPDPNPPGQPPTPI